MKEISYGIRELQAHLSEAIRAVQEGRRVVIVSRNRPVAELVGPRGRLKKLSALERKLERLARMGKLIRPKRRGTPGNFKPLRIGGLAEQVLKDRR